MRCSRALGPAHDVCRDEDLHHQHCNVACECVSTTPAAPGRLPRATVLPLLALLVPLLSPFVTAGDMACFCSQESLSDTTRKATCHPNNSTSKTSTTDLNKCIGISGSKLAYDSRYVAPARWSRLVAGGGRIQRRLLEHECQMQCHHHPCRLQHDVPMHERRPESGAQGPSTWVRARLLCCLRLSASLTREADGAKGSDPGVIMADDGSISCSVS